MFRWGGSRRDPSPEDSKRRKKDASSRSSKKAESVASASTSRHRSSRDDRRDSRKSSSRSVADDSKSRAGDFDSESNSDQDPQPSSSRRSVTWDTARDDGDRDRRDDRKDDRRSSRGDSERSRTSARHSDSDDENPKGTPLRRSSTYDSPQSTRYSDTAGGARERARGDDEKKSRKSSRSSIDNGKESDRLTSKQKSSSRATEKSRTSDAPEQDQGSSRPQQSASQSNRIANQFPDQTPLNYASSALPGEPSFGEAAEYYGDQGQSVAHQPGVRPGTPIIVGAEPHLQPASAEPAPAQDTGHGAAAEFFDDATNDFGSSNTIANSSSAQQASASGGGGRPSKTSSSSFLGRLSSGSSNRPSGRPDSSRPSKMSNAAMAAGAVGAAGLAASALGASGRHQQTSQTQSISTSGGRHSGGSGSSRPSRPSASTIQPSSSQPLASTSSYHEHHEHYGHSHVGRQRQGSRPLDQFVNWWNDYEDIAKMEAYTEFIGVCKHCFDPRSSPADAPRTHVPRRVRSRDSMDSVRIDKDRRYSRTEASRRRQKRDASWLGAGLAGIGLAQAARAVDGYSSASSSGRTSPEMSTSFAAGGRDPAVSRQSDQAAGRRVSPSDRPTSITARPMAEVDPRPLSESKTTSVQRRSSRDTAAVGAMSAAALATADRRPRPHRAEHQPDSPPGTDDRRNDGFFSRIFGGTPKRKTTRRRRSSGSDRMYSLPSSSSSSLDSSLAFGGAGRGRLASPTRKAALKKRRSSDEMARNALIGLGTAAAALAAHKASGSRKSPAKNERYPMQQARLGKQREVKPNAVQGPVYTGSDEGEWESDQSHSSAEHHDLAFGDGIAMTDLEQDSASEHSEPDITASRPAPAQQPTPRKTRNGTVFMGSSPEEPRIVRSTEPDQIDVKAPQSRRPVPKEQIARFDPASPSSQRLRDDGEPSPRQVSRSQTFPLAAQPLPPSILKSSTSKGRRRDYSESEDPSDDDYIPRRRRDDRDDGRRPEKHIDKPFSRKEQRDEPRDDRGKRREPEAPSEKSRFDIPGSFPSGEAAAAVVAGAGAIAAGSVLASKQRRRERSPDRKSKRKERDVQGSKKPSRNVQSPEQSSMPRRLEEQHQEEDWHDYETNDKVGAQGRGDTGTQSKRASEDSDAIRRQFTAPSAPDTLDQIEDEEVKDPMPIAEPVALPEAQDSYSTQVRRPKKRDPDDTAAPAEPVGVPGKSAFASRNKPIEEARQPDPRGSPAPENWAPPPGVPRLVFPSRDPSPDHFQMNINPRLIHPEDGSIFSPPARSALTRETRSSSGTSGDFSARDSTPIQRPSTFDEPTERRPPVSEPENLTKEAPDTAETALPRDAPENDDDDNELDGFTSKSSKKSKKKKKRQSLKEEKPKSDRSAELTSTERPGAKTGQDDVATAAGIAGTGAAAAALASFSFPGQPSEEREPLQRSKSTDLAEIVAQARQAAIDEEAASNETALSHTRSETSRRVPTMSDIVSQAQQTSKREPESGMDQSSHQGPWSTQTPDQRQQPRIPRDQSDQSEGMSPRSGGLAGTKRVSGGERRSDVPEKAIAQGESASAADVYEDPMSSANTSAWPSSEQDVPIHRGMNVTDPSMVPLPPDASPELISEEELYNRFALSASDSKNGSPTNARAAANRPSMSRGPRPARAPSSTSVPFRFRTPKSASTSSVPGESPLASPNVAEFSPSQSSGQTPTRPRRSSRPSSTDFKSSKDIRPLYLVERTRPVQNVDEALPSLPSSRSTSRSSHSASARDTEDAYESAVEEHDLSKATDDEDFASTHEEPLASQAELLSSGQTTPKAGRSPQHSPTASMSSYDTAHGKSRKRSPEGVPLSPEPGPTIESSQFLPLAATAAGGLAAAAALARASNQRDASVAHGSYPLESAASASRDGESKALEEPKLSAQVESSTDRSGARDDALEDDAFVSKAEKKQRKKEAKKGMRLSLTESNKDGPVARDEEPEPVTARLQDPGAEPAHGDSESIDKAEIEPKSAKMSKKEKRQSKRASQMAWTKTSQGEHQPGTQQPKTATDDSARQIPEPAPEASEEQVEAANDAFQPVKLSKKEKRKSKQAQRLFQFEDSQPDVADGEQDASASLVPETAVAEEPTNSEKPANADDLDTFVPAKTSKKEKRKSRPSQISPLDTSEGLASQATPQSTPGEDSAENEEWATTKSSKKAKRRSKLGTEMFVAEDADVDSGAPGPSTESVRLSSSADLESPAHEKSRLEAVDDSEMPIEGKDQDESADENRLETPIEDTQDAERDRTTPEIASPSSERSKKDKRKSVQDEKPSKREKKQQSKSSLTGAGAFAAGVLGFLGGRKSVSRSSSSSSKKRADSVDSRRSSSSRKRTDSVGSRKSSSSKKQSSKDAQSPREAPDSFNSTLAAAEAALRDDEDSDTDVDPREEASADHDDPIYDAAETPAGASEEHVQLVSSPTAISPASAGKPKFERSDQEPEPSLTHPAGLLAMPNSSGPHPSLPELSIDSPNVASDDRNDATERGLQGPESHRDLHGLTASGNEDDAWFGSASPSVIEGDFHDAMEDVEASSRTDEKIIPQAKPSKDADLQERQINPLHRFEVVNDHPETEGRLPIQPSGILAMPEKSLDDVPTSQHSTQRPSGSTLEDSASKASFDDIVAATMGASGFAAAALPGQTSPKDTGRQKDPRNDSPSQQYLNSRSASPTSALSNGQESAKTPGSENQMSFDDAVNAAMISSGFDPKAVSKRSSQEETKHPSGSGTQKQRSGSPSDMWQMAEGTDRPTEQDDDWIQPAAKGKKGKKSKKSRPNSDPGDVQPASPVIDEPRKETSSATSPRSIAESPSQNKSVQAETNIDNEPTPSPSAQPDQQKPEKDEDADAWTSNKKSKKQKIKSKGVSFAEDESTSSKALGAAAVVGAAAIGAAAMAESSSKKDELPVESSLGHQSEQFKGSSGVDEQSTTLPDVSEEKMESSNEEQQTTHWPEDTADSQTPKAQDDAETDSWPEQLSAKDRKKLKKAQKAKQADIDDGGSGEAQNLPEGQAARTVDVSSADVTTQEPEAVQTMEPANAGTSNDIDEPEWDVPVSKKGKKKRAQQAKQAEVANEALPDIEASSYQPAQESAGVSTAQTETQDLEAASKALPSNVQSAETAPQIDESAAKGAEDNDWDVPLSAKEKKKKKKAQKSEAKRASVVSLADDDNSFSPAAEPSSQAPRNLSAELEIGSIDDKPAEAMASDAQAEQDQEASKLSGDAAGEDGWAPPLSAKERKKLKKAQKAQGEPGMPSESSTKDAQPTGKPLQPDADVKSLEQPRESGPERSAAATSVPGAWDDEEQETELAGPNQQDVEPNFEPPKSAKEKKKAKKAQKAQQRRSVTFAEDVEMMDSAPFDHEPNSEVAVDETLAQDKSASSADIESARDVAASRGQLQEREKSGESLSSAVLPLGGLALGAATLDTVPRRKEGSNEASAVSEPEKHSSEDALVHDEASEQTAVDDEWSGPMSKKDKKKKKKAERARESRDDGTGLSQSNAELASGAFAGPSETNEKQASVNEDETTEAREYAVEQSEAVLGEREAASYPIEPASLTKEQKRLSKKAQKVKDIAERSKDPAAETSEEAMQIDSAPVAEARNASGSGVDAGSVPTSWDAEPAAIDDEWSVPSSNKEKKKAKKARKSQQFSDGAPTAMIAAGKTAEEKPEDYALPPATPDETRELEGQRYQVDDFNEVMDWESTEAVDTIKATQAKDETYEADSSTRNEESEQVGDDKLLEHSTGDQDGDLFENYSIPLSSKEKKRLKKAQKAKQADSQPLEPSTADNVAALERDTLHEDGFSPETSKPRPDEGNQMTPTEQSTAKPDTTSVNPDTTGNDDDDDAWGAVMSNKDKKKKKKAEKAEQKRQSLSISDAAPLAAIAAPAIIGHEHKSAEASSSEAETRDVLATDHQDVNLSSEAPVLDTTEDFTVPLSAKERKKLKKAKKTQSASEPLVSQVTNSPGPDTMPDVVDSARNPNKPIDTSGADAPEIDKTVDAEEQMQDPSRQEAPQQQDHDEWTWSTEETSSQKKKKGKKAKRGSTFDDNERQADKPVESAMVDVDDLPKTPEDGISPKTTAVRIDDQVEANEPQTPAQESKDNIDNAVEDDWTAPLSAKEKKKLKKAKKSQSTSEPVEPAARNTFDTEEPVKMHDKEINPFEANAREELDKSTGGAPMIDAAAKAEEQPSQSNEPEPDEWPATPSAKERKKAKKSKKSKSVSDSFEEQPKASNMASAPVDIDAEKREDVANDSAPMIEAEVLAEEQAPRLDDPEPEEWNVPLSSKDKKKLKKAQKAANRTSTDGVHDRENSEKRDILAGAATVAAIGAASAAVSKHDTADRSDGQASRKVAQEADEAEPQRQRPESMQREEKLESRPERYEDRLEAPSTEPSQRREEHEAEQSFADVSHRSNKKGKKKHRQSAIAWDAVVEEAEKSQPWDHPAPEHAREGNHPARDAQAPPKGQDRSEVESTSRELDDEQIADMEEGVAEHATIGKDRDVSMADVPESWDAADDERREYYGANNRSENFEQLSEDGRGGPTSNDRRRYEVTTADAAALLSRTRSRPADKEEDQPMPDRSPRQYDEETERRLTRSPDQDASLSRERSRPLAYDDSPERKQPLESIPELSREPTPGLMKQLRDEEEGLSTRSPPGAQGQQGLTSAALKGLDDDSADWHERSLHPDDSISAVGSRVASREQQKELTSPKGSEMANTRRAYIRSPGQETREAIIRPKSAQSGHSRAGSTTSTHSGTLRRSGQQQRSVSSDLRAANKRDAALTTPGKASSGGGGAQVAAFAAASQPPPANYEPLRGPGKDRRQDMSDGGVYEAWGDARGSPRSPTKPQSIRKRQSTQILELEAQLEDMRAQNKSLHDARSRSRQGYDSPEPSTPDVLQRSLQSRDESLREKDVEIETIKSSLTTLREEISSLTEHNAQLQSANDNLTADVNGRYKTLQTERDEAYSQWQESSRQLTALNERHEQLSGGMESIVQEQIQAALAEKNAQIKSLRAELDEATDRIEELQKQIQSAGDDFLKTRDVDYFDSACQQLCQHVQQWVLRFSKFSDTKMCRLSSQLEDEAIETRLDNAILDGFDVDDLLSDRVKRRDVFMSLVMTMIWEFIFTRYLFGMDREQRQKLKALEKTLAEVGPPRAVAQWRATTLTLLSRRASFAEQRASDTEAVAQEIYSTLERLLPPPRHVAGQLAESLRKVLSVAVDVAIEMRTQRPEYVMLPPLQPEFDTNGDLARTVYFNAALMNERSGETASNEQLEAQQAVLRVVLFPLVVKKGDDLGDGDDEIVVCPAQVLVARADDGRRRVMGHANQSMASVAPSAMMMGPDVGGMV